MPEDVEALRSLARRMHVHFDVDPQLEIRDGIRVKVAVLVRLWGVHAKGVGALPGCSKCRELLARLQPLLDYALDQEAPVPVAIEPLRHALYDSRVVPDADEVALAIRISPPGGASHAGAAEERCLKVLRARFRELGIPER